MKEQNCYHVVWDTIRFSKDKPEEFLQLVNSLLVNQEFDELINIIKKSGIAINKFGGGKSNNKVYKKVLKELSTVKSSDSLNKFLADVDIINSLYRKFYEFYMVPLEEWIPSEAQFSALLINLQLNMMSLEKSGVENPSFDLVNGSLEVLVSYASTIIKFFYYKKYNFENISISEEVLYYSNLHFESAHVRKALEDVTILWSLYDLDLYENSAGQITFDLESCKEIFSCISGHLTYLDIKNNKMVRQSMETLLKFPKNDYIDDAAEFILEYYNVDDLGQKIDDIPLIEYVKAYKVINRLGSSWILRDAHSEDYTIDGYLQKIRDYKLKTKMLKEGISSEHIDKILEVMTFSSKAVDLYDAPLFRLGKDYVFLPFIARTIEPASAIFSNFNSREVDMNLKGDNFELKIKNILSQSNVEYHSYKKIEKKETYQCDLIFKISNTIYFCEIKHFKQPVTFWDFAIVKDKLYEATNQLNRIYKFYSKGEPWETVVKDFDLSPNDNTIKKRRLVVTNILIDSEPEFNGVDVTSEYKFYTYFNQIRPAIHEGSIWNTTEIDVFKARDMSEISSEDFESYIKNNVLLELNKERFFIKSTYFESINLLNKEYSLEIGTFSKLN